MFENKTVPLTKMVPFAKRKIETVPLFKKPFFSNKKGLKMVPLYQNGAVLFENSAILLKVVLFWFL